jgi:putative FmdB family regulatory protein
VVAANGEILVLGSLGFVERVLLPIQRGRVLMPVYEFQCSACGKKFQVVESIKDHDPKKTKCTKCGSSRVERVWSQIHVVTSKKS